MLDGENEGFRQAYEKVIEALMSNESNEMKRKKKDPGLLYFPNIKYKCGKITISPSRLHSLLSSS